MTTENRTFGSSGQDLQASGFVDRRQQKNVSAPGLERRHFSDSHQNLSPEAAELGKAIDQYKLMNRRRFVTYEEMLAVIKSLGYSKN